MKNKLYYFGAGPARLPPALLQRAEKALYNWEGLGLSILEVSHHHPAFLACLEEAKHNLAELLQIPKDYSILFLGGSARAQFGMIALNFINKEQEAGYWITGHWSLMAYQEAAHLKKAYVIASNEAEAFLTLPPERTWQIKKNSAYLYCTANETLMGLRFQKPSLDPTFPLISDMTSSLLTEPIEVSDYALIFAGAQKNIAPAGLTLVIIKNTLLEQIEEQGLPKALDYREQVNTKPFYATPPVFNCYMAAEMFMWLKEQGGIAKLYEENCKKAAALYTYLDNSVFYETKVEKKARSLVNVCFNLRKPNLEPLFLNQAAERGLLGLKGHAKVGGIRASIYNAMPFEGVLALLEYLEDFEKRYSNKEV